MTYQKTPIILHSDQLVSIPRAAEILGRHFTTVYRWLKDGRLHGIQIGNQVYLEIAELEEMKNRTPVA